MIFRNSVAQTAALVTGYVFSFILAPIMLWRLGLAQFGVWAVTGAIATYAALIDLGITRALERFVAFYHARGDRRSVEECFGLGLVAVTTMAVLVTPVVLLAAPWVAHLLDDVLTPAEMRIVMLASAAMLVLGAYRSVLRAVPTGLQRMVEPCLALIAGNVINFAFSLVALAISRDLVVYALANVAAAVVSLIPMAMAVRVTWSPVRVRIPSKAIVSEVLGFSLKSQVAWLGDLVNNQTDKLIIAVLIDVRAAGAYEIANRVVVALKAVAIMSISALTAASTAMIATEGRGGIADFYRRYTPRAMSVALPMLFFAIVCSPALMTAWLDDVPPNAVLVVVVLTLANAVSLTTEVAKVITMGDGRAGEVARVAVIVVILNIVLTIVLAPLFGILGVVGGTALAIAGGSALFLIRFHRFYGVAGRVYAKAVGVPAALAGLAAAPVLLFWLLFAGAAPDERLPAFALAAAFFAVYVAVYWPLATRIGILPERLNMPRVPPYRKAAASSS